MFTFTLNWLKQLFSSPEPEPEVDDDLDWEDDVMDSLRDTLETPEQRPIYKGSMIYKTKEWFIENGRKWPE